MRRANKGELMRVFSIIKRKRKKNGSKMVYKKNNIKIVDFNYFDFFSL